MAWTSVNRLWHKMAAPAVGACIHVYRGNCGATGISVPLSKEADRGAAPPRGDGTSRVEHLTVILTFLRFLTSMRPLAGNSHCDSNHPPLPRDAARSPSLFLGESDIPCRPVCASAKITSILSGGVALFYFSPSLPRVQLSLLLCVSAY